MLMAAVRASLFNRSACCPPLRMAQNAQPSSTAAAARPPKHRQDCSARRGWRRRLSTAARQPPRPLAASGAAGFDVAARLAAAGFLPPAVSPASERPASAGAFSVPACVAAGLGSGVTLAEWLRPAVAARRPRPAGRTCWPASPFPDRAWPTRRCAPWPSAAGRPAGN